MLWSKANDVVEALRAETQLYLPALSKRRGFSSSRVEHLLNRLVARMPASECYLEVGTLEGRTLEAAAHGNDDKHLVGCDPCEKYAALPAEFGINVSFVRSTWQALLRDDILTKPIGLAFYDGDHSALETCDFMAVVSKHLADEAVLVLDDWDRQSVRDGAYHADPDHWRLLREMPEYGDGLTCPSARFGYAFGVSVWGYRRSQ